MDNKDIVKELKKNKELWDLFTNKEEYNPLLLDRFDRFLYHISNHRNVLKPLVSEFFIKNGLKIQYPKNKKFAVCLTHDIDVIYFSKIRTVYGMINSLKKGQIKETVIKSKILFSRKNRRWNSFLNFQKIIDLEKKYNARSSFYFMAQSNKSEDFNYNVSNFKHELKYIVSQGWEVGLHGSRKAHNNLEQIRKEKEKLEYIIDNPIIGYRNHGLHFKTPNTWEYLSKAGFKYDTTFGYVDMVGFRNGICHPFYPFNLNTNKEINILEIPLVIMDGTLFDYMRLNMGNAWKITRLLIDIVEKNNGIMTILWHNTSFDELFYKDWNKLYNKILDYCYKKNAWLTSGRDIYNWWVKSEKKWY